MEPVKLTLPGQFWDSYLYKGRLYLFQRDGAVLALNWDNLISGLRLPRGARLAAECALRRSDYLYGADFSLFFSDTDIRRQVTRKFQALAGIELTISQRMIHECLVGAQDNPFPFPHNDLTIYAEMMHVVGLAGVYKATCNKRTRYPISTKVYRSWDAPSFSVAASYGSLALAAGDEGLWEQGVQSYAYFDDDRRQPSQLSKAECGGCNWMFYSIYGSSYDGGYLAEFKKTQHSPREYTREFSGVRSEADIFREQGYSWGTRDKAYLAGHGQIKVAVYQPYDEEEPFKLLDPIHIQPWKGSIVRAGVASFGTIAEYENAIVVLSSDGRTYTIVGEPINWRVYPNSHHYQNQLHVCFDDRIEIFSFNQDYFVDQQDKVFGSRPLGTGGQTYRSGVTLDDLF
jgi:hypothetical protein